MAKADVVAAQLALVQAAEVQAVSDGLGNCYDQGALDQKASDGTFQQSDIDAAVKAAVDPLNAQIASDATILAAAQAKAVSDLGLLQVSFDALNAKEQLEENAVAGLQASIGQVQAALDAIKAIILPPPPVVPPTT